jgi:predicted DNA-binding WGR domain protein
MGIDFPRNLTGPNVVLERIRPAQNERRFYAAFLTMDLFGNIQLFRNWGRIGTGGRVRFDLYSGAQEATKALENLAQAKQRRGYKTRAAPHV